MAATKTNTNSNSQISYVFVNNIPSNYHSSDLRNYFSQFLEPGCFECFHFRHRPEGKRSNSPSDQRTEVQDKPKDSDPSKKTFCCVVKLTELNLNKFMKMYHRKHWLDNSRLARYKTREEQRCSSHEEETTFTQNDLDKLIELNPPDIMPKGNVGTPTLFFLKLIQQCKLPPVVIKKLGLTFPKTRTNKKYGSVHFDYGGEVLAGTSEEDSVVVSGKGHDLEGEDENSTQGNQAKVKRKDDATDTDDEDNGQDESEEDNDSCEEWERHEAMYDDPSNQERNKERLFEEEIELKWEKGGSGLVFYTDAQYWDAQEGDFDERTTDDLDVDMSIYYEDGAGDKDIRDFIRMRQEQRRRDGHEKTDMYTAGIGKFEKYTKGIGRKVMMRQGWQEGHGLGSSRRGIAEALDNEGQKPHDRRGFGYHGEKLQRYGTSSKARHNEKSVTIATIYDDPEETDPPEKLMRRNEPYVITYRDNIRFHKSKSSE